LFVVGLRIYLRNKIIYMNHILTNSEGKETITHNLGTKDVIVEIYEIESGETIGMNVKRIDENTVEVSANVPFNGDYKAVILAS
jgi:hypothetical protein